MLATIAVLGLAALFAASVVGCSSDDTAEDVSDTTGAASETDHTVNVYLSDSASVSQVAAIRDRIDALVADGTVESYTFVDPAEALAALRERLEDPSILDELTSNPIPASFAIRTSDDTTAKAVADVLTASDGVDPDFGVRVGLPEPLVVAP